MGERKVLNKYYPPDFDPRLIPRLRRPKNQQIKVRMMLPMSVRCGTCGNYIYKGTKFNSRKEDVIGETYLGIQIFRFYFKCTKCSAELTMKTDPQNFDYIVESGASRNYEPWRAEDEEVDKDKQKRDAEEMGDAMKSLENRTLDSKREMDIIAALYEMKSMKTRHAHVSVDAMLEALQRTGAEKVKRIEEEDEAVMKSIFGKQKEVIRRIANDDFDDDDESFDYPSHNKEKKGSSSDLSKKRKASEESSSNPTDILTSSSADKAKEPKKQATSKHLFKSVHIKVIKKQSQPSSAKPEEKKSNGVAKTSLVSLFQDYGSDEDED
ncbi:PREDICTED: coiled-coil domain-containing protein 94 homolog [Camelina sativa]|uniref:Splicing factor YJU2 n=1 Tax=Camelina sativa TaxID=90675 RepID=A0ABM0YB48_CAMSA|nr:PREDICTED: coiled-coil domain-containing protein 94 homolog [Camelina sativa]